MKKGIALISAIIFIGLTITAITLIYNAGMPIINRMQAASSIESMKGVFTELDGIVQQVASEGNGSRRAVQIRLDPGKFVMDGASDKVFWEYDTEAEVFSPRTSQATGNVIFGSGLETSAYLGNYSSVPAYVIENEHIAAYFRVVGNSSSPQAYSMGDVLLGIYQKDTGSWLPIESLEISIDQNPQSESGTGYTILSREGTDLPYATVSAHIDSSYMDYYINFTLESGADFIRIEGYA